jgi:hypothetical protein
MQVDELMITNLESLDRAIVEIQKDFDGDIPCWRGHSNATWELEAGVFRPRPQGGSYSENALISHFKERAVGMLGSRNRPSSELEWLFLAQHYGLPTRLLDWTENPLVALFFAVNAELDDGFNDDKDACIWALSSGKLNKEESCPGDPKQSMHGIVSSDERIVKAIADRAFGQKDTALFKKYNIDPIHLPKVIAIETPALDSRIVAQSGRFSLHDKKGAFTSPVNAKYLRKFVIPSFARKDLRGVLDRLAIWSWNIFPDLQSLAEGLKRRNFSSN